MHACMPPYIECSPYIVTVSVLTCIVILAVLLAYFGGAQVVKSTKHAQERKAKTGPRGYADDANTTADAPKRWSDYTVQFEFPEPTELPPPLIQLNDVSFQYPGRDDFGLKDLNIGVDMGSRVAIVGPNGAGKTTLMNLLSGLLTVHA